MTISFAAKYIAGSDKPVFYVTGKDKDGSECFHFIISTKEKIANMLAIKEGIFDINEYGIVIESGFGEPSAELILKLKSLYKLDV